MHWFFIALISPFLWSISNHIDKYLIGGYLKKIKFTSFVITTSIFTAVFALGIFAFKPSVIHIQFDYFLLLILDGIFSAIYLFPYYQALVYEEASIVVPMFQMIPILGFILGFIFLGEHLKLEQILAGIIIISGALGLSLELNERIRLKSKVFFLMLVSSLIVSFGVLIYKFVALHTGFWTAIFWQQIGIVLTALSLMIVPDYRENFMEMVLRQNSTFLIWEGINEIVSQSAALIFGYSYLLAPIALVQLVGSVQPLFVLILGIGVSIFPAKFFPEDISRKFLIQKVMFICLILFGSYLLFRNL